MSIMASLGLLALLVLLLIGTPIYISLGGLSIVLLLIEGASPIGIGQKILDHMNSATLMAIPFFVIAAGFIQGGGIAKALIDMASTWIGRLPGGIALSGLVATAIFAAISGSSVATVLAMGTMVVPEMLRNGYSRPFALGLTASAGTLGILIPPSMPMVVYGLVSETSIPRLFLAGVVPGLIQITLFTLVIVSVAILSGTRTLPFPGLREAARVNLRALPAMAVPIIVLGGIYGGFVTVTEAAALSALVALGISVFVYRTLRIRDIPDTVVQGISRTAAILLIVAGAHLLSYWMTRDGLAVHIATIAIDMELTGTQFLFVMAGVLLILGMVLEGYAIILITLPLTLPIVHALGIDPVQFGIFMVIGIELAMLTPPIGLNVFVMAEVAKAPVREVLRGLVPFFLSMLVLWVAVILFPELSTALPDLVLGGSR